MIFSNGKDNESALRGSIGIIWFEMKAARTKEKKSTSKYFFLNSNSFLIKIFAFLVKLFSDPIFRKEIASESFCFLSRAKRKRRTERKENGKKNFFGGKLGFFFKRNKSPLFTFLSRTNKSHETTLISSLININ